MTENGSVPGCEHCRHPLSLPGDPPRAEDIDAKEDLAQQPTLDPSGDSSAAQPEIEQLNPRDNPVLPLRQSGYRLILLAS
jgi:hypothetical protein